MQKLFSSLAKMKLQMQTIQPTGRTHSGMEITFLIIFFHNTFTWFFLLLFEPKGTVIFLHGSGNEIVNIFNACFETNIYAKSFFFVRQVILEIIYWNGFDF